MAGDTILTSSGKPLPNPGKPVQVAAHTRAAPAPKTTTAKPPAPKAKVAMVAPGLAANNPLLNPNQTLSGAALYKAAQGLAATQDQGPITELQKQIAANNAQTQGTIGQVGSQYQQLLPFVQQGVTDQANISSGLNSQLGQIGQNTQSQLQGIGQGALSSLLKYAPQGDGGLANAATTDLAAQIARQQGLAAQQSGTSQAFGATQGANYQGMGASQLGTFGLQGQEALKNIAQSGTVKNEPDLAKVAADQGTESALTATDLGKLRQQEITNQISRAGLGIKQQTANTTAANDTTKNKIASTNATTAQQRVAVTQQNNLANQELKNAGLGITKQNDLANQQIKQAAAAAKATGVAQKPLTLVSNNLANAHLTAIVSAIAQWQQDGMKNSKGVVQVAHPTNAQMQQILGSEYASPLIQAAFELKGWGLITPQTAQALHNMGIRNSTYKGQPVKVGNPPQAAPNPLLPAPGTPNTLAPASTGIG